MTGVAPGVRTHSVRPRGGPDPTVGFVDRVCRFCDEVFPLVAKPADVERLPCGTRAPDPGSDAVRLRSERDRLAHDLATAEAYQATYAHWPLSPDPYVALMRANNDAEILRLRERLAAPDPGSEAPTDG